MIKNLAIFLLLFISLEAGILDSFVEVVESKNSSFITQELFNKGRSVVPDTSGVYFWYFTKAPNQVPLDKALIIEDRHLLYIGESVNLRERINRHFNKKAKKSTLRRTIGCLLGFKLKEKKFTADEEKMITDYISQNASVRFVPTSDHEYFEKLLIKHYKPPLNIEHNRENSEYLSMIRRECRQ